MKLICESLTRNFEGLSLRSTHCVRSSIITTEMMRILYEMLMIYLAHLMLAVSQSLRRTEEEDMKLAQIRKGDVFHPNMWACGENSIPPTIYWGSGWW